MREVYSKFNSDNVRLNENLQVSNNIIEINDDEPSHEVTDSEIFGENASRNVDFAIKTENDENIDQAIDMEAIDVEVSDVEPKVEEMENDDIPIACIPANQLTGTCTKVLQIKLERIQHDTNRNIENIENGVKPRRSKVAFSKKGTNISSNDKVRESHKKRSQQSNKKQLPNASNEVNIESAANEMDIQVATVENVRNGQMTLDKWINEKQKNTQSHNKGPNISKKNQTIEQSQKPREAIAKSTNGKQFKCDQCQKIFSKKNVFNVHIKRHTEIKPHQCNICSNGFYTKLELNNHLSVHEETRLFQCNQCEKRFKRQTHLSIHMKIHGEKRYQCDHYSKRFSTKDYCNRHMLLAHQHNTFPCYFCFRPFSQIIDKEAHEKVCKRRRYECYLCNRVEKKEPYVKYRQLKTI